MARLQRMAARGGRGLLLLALVAAAACLHAAPGAHAASGEGG
jgi:hypothetical protein